MGPSGAAAGARPKPGSSRGPDKAAHAGVQPQQCIYEAETGVFLHLPDPALEREYWQARDSALGLGFDIVGCLLNLWFPATYLRAYLRDPANWRRHGPLARAMAPNVVLLAGALLQLLLAAFRRPAYRAARMRLHAAMRVLRLGAYVLGTIMTHDVTIYWRARLTAEGADPARSVAVMTYVLPLTFLTTSLTNPVPVALQPAFAAATLFIFAKGWLPHIARLWEDARLAVASLALCARLRLAQQFAEAAASAVFGSPCPDAAAAGASGPPSLRACSCLLQTLATAAALGVGIALPCAAGWWSEYRSKAHFLRRTRGLELRLRAPLPAPLHGWVRVRCCAALAWPGAWAALSLLAAAAVVTWQLAAVFVALVSPGCDAAAGA